MINATDIEAMKPVTLYLDDSQKDPTDWLHRMINLASTGTRIVYWVGLTDVDPKGRRKQVFEFMMGASNSGRVRLMQRRVTGGVLEYIGEVR